MYIVCFDGVDDLNQVGKAEYNGQTVDVSYTFEIDGISWYDKTNGRDINEWRYDIG